MAITERDIAEFRDRERMRAEFLAMVCHDLRGTLTSIKGAATTVLGAKYAFGFAEMVQLFRIIDRQADQMSRLINDLLDVGRMETGTLPVNPEPTPVAALVDQARSTFQSGGNTHTIRIDLPLDLPPVMVDPQRIAQVLGNLLANAARRSRESSIIRVSAVAEGAHVAVSVEDRGARLDPGWILCLFQLSAALEKDERGDADLGLSISKGIVEAHGGRIWAESDRQSRGAKFTFTVPVLEETPPESVAISATAAVSDQGMRRRRERILTVDDDPQTLRYLHGVLTKAGYASTVTGDPMEALDLLEASRHHLVLLDLVLPGIDGVELLQEIRTVADVPVIFISAYGHKDAVARAFDMGAEDYLVKPLSPTELTARIRAALRRREAPETEEPSKPYVRGDLVVDFAARRVSLAGRLVRVTVTEYRLLVELAANAGRTLTHCHLLEQVWSQGSAGDLRSMRSTVKTLRRRLGDDAHNPAYIFTERHIGYRMPKGEERS